MGSGADRQHLLSSRKQRSPALVRQEEDEEAVDVLQGIWTRNTFQVLLLIFSGSHAAGSKSMHKNGDLFYAKTPLCPLSSGAWL